MSATRCLYVTSGWGVHDERWMTAIQSVGFDPISFSLGRDASSLDQLRAMVEVAASGSTPVLAGPLTTITHHLVGIDAYLVGLSWGFDLYELEEEGNPNWLTKLDGLIVDSLATQAIAVNCGVDTVNITMLPWGVDLEQFTPDGPKADLTCFGIPPDTQVILSARAHEPLYKVGDLITAFADVSADRPKAHLLIAHDGSLTSLLIHQAHNLGIGERVHFIGKVDESVLPSILRSCACYVTGSSVDGTSVTLLQAMACRTPVVASNSLGNLDWITDGQTGTTFPIGDTSELANSMRNCLDHEQTFQIENALELVRARANWTINIHVLQDALSPVN